MGHCYSKLHMQHNIQNKSMCSINAAAANSPKKCMDTHEQASSNDIGDGCLYRSEAFPKLNTTPRLENTQRKRLSVSTVTKPADVLPTKSEETGSASVSTAASSHDSMDKNEIVSCIHKYTDPASELINVSTGSVRFISIDTLSELFSDATSAALILGAPSEQTQRGFDNKTEEVYGVSTSNNVLSKTIGYACKKGLKPESPNQDDFFILKVNDWWLYGVFDGHGPYGHRVSNFVHKTLPFLLLTNPLFETDPIAVMKKSFRMVFHLLEILTSAPKDYGHIDCSLSGTTATIVLHRGSKLYVSHVGDSRAVVGKKVVVNNTCYYEAINLTEDHKPMCFSEKLRIESLGGEVRRLEGDIPYRVFVKHRLYPGLAMSRALGDTIGSAIGVIPDPDVKVINITSDIEYMIIATDGVWEFITSQEAINLVTKTTPVHIQEAADFLAYESWRRWIKEEENVVDDVTCLIISLKKNNS